METTRRREAQMRTIKRTAGRAVGILVTVAPMLFMFSVPASAGAPPPAPVTVTLTCDTGTYSYVQGLAIDNSKGHPLFLGIDLECGLANNPFAQPQGYPISTPPLNTGSRVGGYSVRGNWFCANPAAPRGAETGVTSDIPFNGKSPWIVRCPVPSSTNGSAVTLTIS